MGADTVIAGAMARPGQGPPAATRRIYSCEVLGVAEGESGEWAHILFSSGDAYEFTAMSAIAGALVLHEEGDHINPRERGGILTPGFAFHGSTWTERLVAEPFG